MKHGAEVPLGSLAGVFLRLGNLTFGGGDPTMAALHRELVPRRGWLGAAQYALVYALARVTPGTNVLAFCAGSAWFVRGWPAAVLAVGAVTIPSALFVIWVTYEYQRLHANPLAAHVVSAMLASAVGLMFAAAWSLLRPALHGARAVRALVLFGAALALLAGGVSPILVLAGAAAAGLAWQAA